MFEILLATFNNGVINVFILILFVLTLLKGILQYNRFYYLFRDIKFYINVISAYIVYLFYDFITYELYNFILNTFNLHYMDGKFGGLALKLFLFGFAFVFFIIVFRLIYTFLFKKLVMDIYDFIYKLPFYLKSLLFGILKFPKVIFNVLVFVFVLNTFSMFLSSESSFNKKLNSSWIYNSLVKNVISPFKYDLNKIMLNIFDPILDVFEEIGVGNIKYLYNGVTIDEATKGNEKIEKFIKESTKGITSSYEKAKKIYNDVIDMLEYDTEKSENIFNEDFDSSLSGAISAFETGKGICFDYASLYSVFAESMSLPTRIVIGKGFDGSEWINHAWNEAYIDELDKWIQIDTTFGETGNYFDIDDFEQDHKKEKIIWEFSV